VALDWVVEADCLVEQRRETDGKDAGAAAGVQEPPTPIEAQLVG
jgi:hypothetical protein